MSILKRRAGVAAVACAAALALSAPNAFAASPGDDSAVPISVDGAVVVASQDAPTAVRIAGKDRVATAIKAACSRTFSKHAILASSSNFADALASGPLADAWDAPIIVTPDGSSLDPQVLAYFALGCDGKAGTRDEITSVTITSGTGVLTDGIVKQLKDAITWDTKNTPVTTDDVLNGGAAVARVDRVAGANRYQTSAAIAWTVPNDWASTPEIFFADGNNFPDALAAGAAAANHRGVVLLTMEDDGLDSSTFKYATSKPWANYAAVNHGQLWAVGGNAAKAVKKGHLGEAVEIPASQVLVGEDRYETAAMLAKAIFVKPVDAVVASGESYADAVFAGGYAANLDAPLLLTNPSTLSSKTADYLKAEAANKLARVIVMGGTGSVTPAVQGQIVTAITAI